MAFYRESAMQTDIVFQSMADKSQLTRSLIMEQARRKFLATSIAGGAVVAAWGLLHPMGAYAAQFNTSAAKANNLADAFQGLGVNNLIESREITIKAPEIAETGFVVPVEITSNIAHTSAIALLVEKNPNPLSANFAIASGTEGYVSTRVKMSNTSPMHVVVQANGRFYHTVKDVKVTLGGCGNAGSPDVEKEFHVEPARVRTQFEGDVCLFRMLMNHPMESGQRRDLKTGQLVAPHFIQSVIASVNGRTVMEAQWTQAVSRNPFLGFKVKGVRKGDRVSVAWMDNLGNKNTNDTIIGA